MNGAELTRRPLPSCAGQPWTTAVEATRGPGGAPEQGLQGCSRPRSAALPEEWMQEGDRSLVCVQTENPGPATRPCCVRCWVCRGEVNAFSFPSPAPWHCVQRPRATAGLHAVTPTSAAPLPAPRGGSAGWRTWSHRPPSRSRAAHSQGSVSWCRNPAHCPGTQPAHPAGFLQVWSGHRK